MKLYRFELEIGKLITQYDSVNVSLTHIMKFQGNFFMVCMKLGEQGRVGYHPAANPQLFMVVEGDGWVLGEDQRRVAIKPGEAAFWQKDEWHSSGTETGLKALVIEGEGLDPSGFMEEIDFER